MDTPTAVKVGTWIEREVHGTYCRWTKVVHVYQEDWISVVYLDGDTPVKDDFQLVDGRWDFKYDRPSGFTIREVRLENGMPAYGSAFAVVKRRLIRIFGALRIRPCPRSSLSRGAPRSWGGSGSETLDLVGNC